MIIAVPAKRYVLFSLALLGSLVLSAQSWEVYEGLMGERSPVRVLIQRSGEEARGLILDLAREQLLPMEGKASNGGLQLTAAQLREKPTLQDGLSGFQLVKHAPAGRLQVDGNGKDMLRGEWVAISRKADIPGSASFRLQKRSVPRASSPFELRKLLLGEASEAEFQFALAEQLIGADLTALYYFGSQGDPRQIRRQDMHIDILDRNLMGDQQEESLMVITWADGLYILAPFRKNGRSDQALGYHLTVKKPEPRAAPCRIKAPGNGYFFYEFQEIFAPGEFALVGRTYGGHCEGVTRRDQVRFYIWRFTGEGLRKVYEDVQDYYVYESPDPASVEPAVFNEFSLAPGARSAFPKRLKKTEHPAIHQPGKKAVPSAAESRVTFIELE